MSILKEFQKSFVDGLHDTQRAMSRDLESISTEAAEVVADIGHGIVDTLSGFIAFPTVTLQYITGTTNHFGEIGSWRKFGSRYKVRNDYSDNPLMRTVIVVNHMVYGSIDLLLGHLPYRASVELGMQQYTPFFSPPPTDARGLSRDMTAVAMIFALPIVKTKGYALLEIPEKTVPISEGSVFRELTTTLKSQHNLQLHAIGMLQQEARSIFQRIVNEYFSQLMTEERPGFARGAIEIPNWMLPAMTIADICKLLRQNTVSDADLVRLTQYLDAKVTEAARQVLKERSSPALEAQPLFIVALEYKVPLDLVDAHLAAHRAFLDQCYNDGVFIVSGKKVPRTGGIIVASVTDKASLEAILAKDPFKINDLADYHISEFVPGMFSNDFATVLRYGNEASNP